MFGRKRVMGWTPSPMGYKRAKAPWPVPAIVVRNRAPKTVRRLRSDTPELKVNDIAKTAYAANTTGSVTALNLLAVGDDNTTRDGRQVFNTSLHVQGILAPEDTACASVLCRMLIVWDKQPSGAAIPVVTDILQASDSVSDTNLNNRERFQILRDCRYASGQVSEVATVSFSNGNNTYMVNEYIKLNKKTTYNATTAAIASIATGSLLMVTIGSQAAGLGGSFILATRLRFTDH